MHRVDIYTVHTHPGSARNDVNIKKNGRKLTEYLCQNVEQTKYQSNYEKPMRIESPKLAT